MRSQFLYTCVLALGLAACEGLSSSPEPAVSVLVRTSTGCFALMTTAQPIAPVLKVGGQCVYDSPPQLVAGIDLVETVIDYGPDVQFATDTSAPPPTVTVTVDGAPTDQPVTVSAEQRVGNRAYFIATFRAPSTPSEDVQITAGVNPGFQTTVPLTFETLAPSVELSILECSLGVACDIIGGVGQIQVEVYVPGDVPETVALQETIAGVMQPGPVASVTTAPAGSETSAITAISVPAAPAGSQLQLSAQLDNGPTTVASVTITAPPITATLTCGSTCNAGDTVGLTITAPAGIAATQAIVDASLDGVPDVVQQPAALQTLDGLATAMLALDVPSDPGTWTISVSVAGYEAEIAATVQ